MNQEQIKEALWGLRKEPETYTKDGTVFVKFASGEASLTEVRKLLATDEDLCDELVDENKPLEWVFTHEGERVDVSPQEDALIREVEDIAAREWDLARFVLAACIKKIGGREAQRLDLLSS